MRLICPNCGAQYEVPVDVIPEGGRDVECSNCAHTWFQHHPDDSPELTGEAALEDAIWATGPDEDDLFDPPPPPKRQLDPEVAEVLRQEAERELRARQAEAARIETQTELGLSAPEADRERRARQARERMAKIKGDPEPQSAPESAPPTDPDMPATVAPKRRDMLPDVDELNQSLRSGPKTGSRSDRKTASDPDDSPRVVDSAEGRHHVDETPITKSFGGGFLSIVLLAAAAIAAYVFATPISDSVPPAAPWLDGYVAQVDAGRAWLEAQFAQLISTLDGMSSEAAPADPASLPTDQGSNGTGN